MKPKKNEVTKQTETNNSQSQKSRYDAKADVQPSHVPIGIEGQLEAFADLLIDHYLKSCHEKE